MNKIKLKEVYPFFILSIACFAYALSQLCQVANNFYPEDFRKITGHLSRPIAFYHSRNGRWIEFKLTEYPAYIISCDDHDIITEQRNRLMNLRPRVNKEPGEQLSITLRAEDAEMMIRDSLYNFTHPAFWEKEVESYGIEDKYVVYQRFILNDLNYSVKYKKTWSVVVFSFLALLCFFTGRRKMKKFKRR